MNMARIVAVGLALALAIVPISARAQSTSTSTETTTTTTTPAESAPTTTTTTTASTDEMRVADDQARRERDAAPPPRSEIDPFEEEGRDYFFLGLLYRQVVVPNFVVNWFGQGTITTSNPGVGLEFNYRKNSFNVSADVWWQNFTFSGAFRANGDPVTDTEVLYTGSSYKNTGGFFDFGVLFLASSFMWSTAITDWFAIEYGADLGFGFVMGKVTRVEANPDGRGGFVPCASVGMTEPGGDVASQGAYCGPTLNGTRTDPDGGKGEHYNVEARKWFDGGSVPSIWPWVGARFALRFKPIHQLQARIDVGIGTLALSFGGSISYGF